MSVTKGVLNNGLATIVQRVVRILEQLLLIPFFLTSWGAAYYGEWLTLSIIPSVLAFSDLGFGSAVSNSFVLAYAAGEKQRAANLRKTGFWIITGSVFLGSIITAIVMFAGKEMHLFDKSLIDAKSAIIAVSLMMTSKLTGFYSQLAEGFFRGARKAALGSFLGSGNNIIKLLTGFCVLHAGYGIIGFAFSQFIVSIAFIIIYLIIGSKQINLKGYTGKILKSDIKSITAKGMGYMMTPIWQSIYFQGGTFVVRLVLGAESVAIFNTVRTICRSVNQMFSIINGSIFPDLQYEYGQGNYKTVHRLFRIAVLLSMFLGIIGTFFLVVFGRNIYEWWTQSVLNVPSNVWFIFMIGVLLNAVWWTSVITYRMTNRPYHFAVMSTVSASISVATSYLLSIRIGLTGAASGAVIYDLIMAFYVLPDSCHILGLKVKDLFYNIREDFHFIVNKIRHIRNILYKSKR